MSPPRRIPLVRSIISVIAVVTLFLILWMYNQYGTQEVAAESDPPVDFTDVAVDSGFAGVSMANAAWGDYDNDGLQDILLNGNRLFRNNGPPEWDFTEIPQGIHGINAPTYSGVWGDYDNDGDLDLFTVSARSHRADCLWENQGNGTFTDISTEAGIRAEEDQCGRGVNCGDYDNDRDMDIYVANYRLDRNYLWENLGDGTFLEMAEERGVEGDVDQEPDGNDNYGHSIGAAWADLDNDGDMDMFVANLAHNNDPVRGPICDNSKLYRNDGEGSDYSFTNIIDSSGIENKDFPHTDDQLYSCPAWGDYDNDGDMDLYITQVYADIDYAYSYMYRNNGDSTFTDVAVDSGVRVWDSWGASWSDYDNDGDLDLLVGGRDGPDSDTNPRRVHLFRNEGNLNQFIKFQLTGNGTVNRDAMGSRIAITANIGSDILIREVEGGTGCTSQQPPFELHIGIGDNQPDELGITWGRSGSQRFYEIPWNKTVVMSKDSTFFTLLGPEIDLISLTADNITINEGDSVNLTWNLTNTGWLAAHEVVVEILDHYEDDISHVAYMDIGAVRQLEEGTFQYEWYADDLAGDHVLEVRIHSVDDTIVSGDSIHVDIMVKGNLRPRAVLSADITETLRGTVITFTGVESHDPDGEIEAWNFDFGDGNSTGWISEDSEAYSYIDVGVYTARLTVRDVGGKESLNPAWVRIRVINSLPVAVFEVEYLVVSEGEDVDIDAGSSRDLDGSVVEYLIDPGDGTAFNWQSTSHLIHSYHEYGSYIINLTVKDNDGGVSDTISRTITVVEENERPVAILTSSAIKVEIGDEVILMGEDSFDRDGSITGYSFYFGDGNTTGWMVLPTVHHSYIAEGVYTVTLKVKDDLGAVSEPTTIIIEVLAWVNDLPVPRLFIDPAQPKPNQEIFMDASDSYDPDGEIVQYRFEFGDGTETVDTAPQVYHMYTSMDTFQLKLTVVDDLGAQDTQTMEITTMVEIPWVTITSPLNGTQYEGGSNLLIVITGKAGASAEKVYVNIDHGFEWIKVTGTTSWSLNLPASFLSSGEHVVRVRAWNGYEYSDTTEVRFTILKPEEKEKKDDEGFIPGFETALLLFTMLISVHMRTVVRSIRKNE